MIEGGRDNKDDPFITNPLLFMAHLSPANGTTLLYTGGPEPQIGGRQLTVPAGGILGGGSSINMMQYTRAQRHDWDSWKAEGWSADEMIPYLKKVGHTRLTYAPMVSGVFIVFISIFPF